MNTEPAVDKSMFTYNKPMQSYNGNIGVKEFNFFPKRSIHREITSQTALNMVRKIINE